MSLSSSSITVPRCYPGFKIPVSSSPSRGGRGTRQGTKCPLPAIPLRSCLKAKGGDATKKSVAFRTGRRERRHFRHLLECHEEGDGPNVSEINCIMALENEDMFVEGRLHREIDLAKGFVALLNKRLNQEVPDAFNRRVARMESRDWAYLPGRTHICSVFEDDFPPSRIPILASRRLK